ncbi:MAG: sigma-70 family RNA polymerase sigma factor, partial [Protaetiibacter sp.]
MTLHDDAVSALPSDAELLAAVRGGDDDAYGVLYARHAGAALRVAKRMTIGTPLSAEDAVSQAFLNVLAAIRAGNGPGDSFRAYLYTVVRNEIMASRERESHVIAVDAPEDLETPRETPDPVVTAYESGVVGRAFSSLPERWQAVLWYHEVEGMKPGAIAPLLGLGANATSALLVRAREGLREAYLSAHVEAADRPECRWSAERMGPHVRGSLSRRDRRRLDAHLEDCADCRAMLAEVAEVARGLRVVIAPLVLGG